MFLQFTRICLDYGVHLNHFPFQLKEWILNQPAAATDLFWIYYNITASDQFENNFFIKKIICFSCRGSNIQGFFYVIGY